MVPSTEEGPIWGSWNIQSPTVHLVWDRFTPFNLLPLSLHLNEDSSLMRILMQSHTRPLGWIMWYQAYYSWRAFTLHYPIVLSSVWGQGPSNSCIISFIIFLVNQFYWNTQLNKTANQSHGTGKQPSFLYFDEACRSSCFVWWPV